MATHTPPTPLNATMAARERLAQTAENVGVNLNPAMQLFFAYSAPAVLNAFSALLNQAHQNGIDISEERLAQLPID